MLDESDLSRMRNIDRIIREHSNRELVTSALGQSASVDIIEKLSELCLFAHGALLVFPEHVDDVIAVLRLLGYKAGVVVPSVVVKNRLAARYGLDNSAFQLQIVHGSTTAANGEKREVEVFMSITPPISKSIAWEERAFEYETHFAVKVDVKSGHTLTEVADLLCAATDFRKDGGGYNPFEDEANGGTTLMYFIRPAQSEEDKLFRRLEVQCSGDYSHLLPNENDPFDQRKFS